VFVLILVVDSHTFAHADAYASKRKAVNFNLNNWDGRAVSMQNLNGKVVILTFSYAYCSALCPIITARLFSLDNTMNSPQNVVYLHVSVDPSMDTSERRRKYFNLYGIDALKDSRWMFISGQKSELSKLWSFYGVTMKRVKNKRLPEGYYIQYTPKLVIIDKEGFIRHETGFDFSEDEVIEKIRGME
jgi:protein SCO1/2